MCKKLIDANEAYEIARTSGLHNDFGMSMADLTSLEELFEDCTAVDAVEVVHGRWHIEWQPSLDPITGETGEYPEAICPFCGHKEYGYDYCDEYWAKPYNYCPNCGAKMDGGNEEMREKQLELVEAINNYFGCDAAYFDIDAFTLAKRIMEAGWEKPVRCKDCYKQNTSWCPMDSKRMRVSGFCSYGERRSE